MGAVPSVGHTSGSSCRSTSVGNILQGHAVLANTVHTKKQVLYSSLTSVNYNEKEKGVAERG